MARPGGDRRPDGTFRSAESHLTCEENQRLDGTAAADRLFVDGQIGQGPEQQGSPPASRAGRFHRRDPNRCPDGLPISRNHLPGGLGCYHGYPAAAPPFASAAAITSSASSSKPRPATSTRGRRPRSGAHHRRTCCRRRTPQGVDQAPVPPRLRRVALRSCDRSCSTAGVPQLRRRIGTRSGCFELEKGSQMGPRSPNA
jgi:hypothetical protein